jgi:hypothetical protein
MKQLTELSARYHAVMGARAPMKPLIVISDDLSVSIASGIAELGHDIAIAPLTREELSLCEEVSELSNRPVEQVQMVYAPGNLPTFFARYSVQVVVGRGVQRVLYDQINQLSFGFKAPYITGFIDSDLSYKLGPLVVPGVGACYQCYERRLHSNHRCPEILDDMDLLYRRNPSYAWEGALMAFDSYYACAIVMELDRVLSANCPRSLSSLLVIDPLRQSNDRVFFNRLEYCVACGAHAEAIDVNESMAEFVRSVAPASLRRVADGEEVA